LASLCPNRSLRSKECGRRNQKSKEIASNIERRGRYNVINH